MPEHLVAEIVAGERITSPRPAVAHTNAASNLGFILGGPFRFGIQGPGGWVILNEPGLHLCEDVLVPDLAGWRRERMPRVPVDASAFTLPPDWICEVLSPSTEALDRARKMPVYAREQVAYAWLVDPLVRTLEVYHLEGSRWVLLGTFMDNAKVRAEPFDAVELDLSVLWAE